MHRILTIGGSDSSAGAGIQADLKTIAALGGYGLSAVTAVTAQTADRVIDIHPVPMRSVRLQIATALEVGVDAVKVGMLATEDLVLEVVRQLADLVSTPIVVDPLMAASDGTQLGRAAGGAAFEQLLEMASVVTPNLIEAGELVGRTLRSLDDQRAAARAIGRRTGAVLVTGGHLDGPLVVDVLFSQDELFEIARPRIVASGGYHGTGCTLSSALAVHLARGRPLREAAIAAVDYVRSTMLAALALGGEAAVLHHFGSESGGAQEL